MSTPEILWRYVHPKNSETTEATSKAYAAFPGSGWHIGGFSNHIGYGDCCRMTEKHSRTSRSPRTFISQSIRGDYR